MTPPLEGLIEFLMAKHRLTRERATKRAEWIVRQQAERAAAKKKKLESAQLTLPIDGAPADGEEPANRFEPTEDVPF